MKPQSTLFPVSSLLWWGSVGGKLQVLFCVAVPDLSGRRCISQWGCQVTNNHSVSGTRGVSALASAVPDACSPSQRAQRRPGWADGGRPCGAVGCPGSPPHPEPASPCSHSHCPGLAGVHAGGEGRRAPGKMRKCCRPPHAGGRQEWKPEQTSQKHRKEREFRGNRGDSK